MTEVHHTIAGLRQALARRRAQGHRVAFVPTMGYLHEGHLSLMRLARPQAQTLVVSIFVNPTQFGPNEDLSSYPRDFPRDLELCRSVGVDLIFAPEPSEVYAPDAATTVAVTGLTDVLCGASRPTHFQGVTTVVSKLFNIVQPDVAVFGQKDYQQLAVIRRMVRDLNIPVEVVGGPIVREADGLAMSSRNVRLDPEARTQALALSRALARCEALATDGLRDGAELMAQARAIIEAQPLAEVDYISLVDPDSLAPVARVGEAGALMALAVRFGATRLIDNRLLGAPSGPERGEEGAR